MNEQRHFFLLTLHYSPGDLRYSRRVFNSHKINHFERLSDGTSRSWLVWSPHVRHTVVSRQLLYRGIFP